MKVLRSESSFYPQEIDDQSSPTTVFHRVDIVETTKDDGFGNMMTWYEFEERQYTRAEWRELSQEEFNLETDFRLTMIELEV